MQKYCTKRGKMGYLVKLSQDGTQLVEFIDGRKSVIIPTTNDKISLCVSSQIGCGMNCKFCRAGKFIRNLTDKEILHQFEKAKEISGKTPNSIVVMGMGEPMMNFTAVDKVLRQINSEYGISFRHITLSTSGIRLHKLVDVPYHVAISLHSADEDKRKELMPGTCTVHEILDFVKKYTPGRRNGAMIEYACIKGVNDSDEDIEKLIEMDWPEKTNFNLIEFNALGEYKPSEKLQEIKQKIINAGHKCFIRHSRGKDIEASCGMLEYTNEFLE